MGLARVCCANCGHEYLLAFSCKRCQVCPSCHQKRVIEYGEWLLTNVLKDVPHRQWVFSIPKRLRIYFLFNRKLLAKLSICAWKVIKAYLKSTVSDENAGARCISSVSSKNLTSSRKYCVILGFGISVTMIRRNLLLPTL